jgi:hypothetical protein
VFVCCFFITVHCKSVHFNWCHHFLIRFRYIFICIANLYYLIIILFYCAAGLNLPLHFDGTKVHFRDVLSRLTTAAHMRVSKHKVLYCH